MNLKNKQTKVTNEKKKPNVKLYLLFALGVLLIFGLYRVVIYMVEAGMIAGVWFSVLMWAYLILAGASFLAVVVLNRGFSSKPVTADQLPSSWDHVKKTEYMANDARRRRIAKYILIPCVAFIFVFIYEIIELFYVPVIKDWLASF